MLRRVHHRAAIKVHLGCAHAHLGKGLGDAADKFVKGPALHQQAAACGASLAGILDDGTHDDRYRPIGVHVVEYDLR